jgi:hypothetical protein
MTEVEAKAMVGKRVRTLGSRYRIPPGTEGILLDARAPGIKITVVSRGDAGALQLTDASWCVYMNPDNLQYSHFPVWEWDESLEEI